MLDSFYHMTLKLLKNRMFGLKTSIFCHLLTQRKNGRQYVTLLTLLTTGELSISLHGVISLPADARRHVIKK